MAHRSDELTIDSPLREKTGRRGQGKIRKIIFYALAGLLSIFLLFAFWDIIPGVVLGWLPDDMLAAIHSDIARLFVPHGLHQMSMHALLWGLVLGVALQLYQPWRWVAPLLQALTFMLAFVVIELAVGQPPLGSAVPALVLALFALLHPGRQHLLRLPRLNRLMVGLTALAAIPWILFALGQIELSRLNLPADAHDQMEHWNRMAVFGILMIVWALIASTDIPGWRLTAWIVAYGSIVYGLQSLFFASQASAVPAGWAIAAAAWGVVYLIAVEIRARSSTKAFAWETAQPG